jgi:hypothetical protein
MPLDQLVQRCTGLTPRELVSRQMMITERQRQEARERHRAALRLIRCERRQAVASEAPSA